MHDYAYCAVAQMLLYVTPPTRVLEIGSRNINGSVRPLFGQAGYIGIDTRPGPGVDVVADGTSYVPPLPPNGIVCCEVLEHCPDQAEAIVRHAAAILDPGGSLLVTCAAPNRAPHSAVHGCALEPGEPYQNLDPEAMRSWLESSGLRIVDLTHRPDRGDLYVCATKEAAA